MKKLFNSRFLFILASSIVVLILLTVGAFYLFNDEDDVFISSGYVLNPLSSTAEKYFFVENTGYKENLSSMIEFVDVDEKEVSILKDSFLHYDDESLSFMKKGAILDLDTMKGNKIVSFYNITKKSVIKKQDNGYVIESVNGDIKLNNFIGRISDDKYIVVGNLSLKLSGNDKTIDGEYFEIVYVEEGIVNIENKNVKYQVAADGTVIYVGNKTIDLGNKKIALDGKDMMSITAITIDGDENIEIIPKGNKEEEEEPENNDGDSAGGDNTPLVPDNNTQPGTDEPNEEPGDGTTGGENVGESTQDIVITLKSAKTGSTDIDVIFDVINAKEDDLFKLQVVNLSSGRTVDMVAQVLTDVPIEVNLLTPNTKYLFTVVNEKDGGKYFQKVLETTNFGIKLEKSYATTDSLVYKLTIDEGTDITNARISLQKFNEETMEYEIVTTSYEDPNTNKVFTEKQEEYLAIKNNKLVGEYEFVYDHLDSNTIYTVVLDEFFVDNSNFNDIYEIALTSMTLKKIPDFSEMVIEKNIDVSTFDLSLGKIDDPDNAIVSYTYVIYDKMFNKMAIDPIVHTNASPITVKVGNGENQLKNDTNYYYNVIIEYFDNEKYIEYVTSDSIIFMMGNDPYVEVIPDEENITHDTLVATIKLKDTSCLISQPGRENCGGESTTRVIVREVSPQTGEKSPEPAFNELVTFTVDGDNITYLLEVSDLTPGAIYNVEVVASYNNTSDLEQVVLEHTEESVQNIKIKSLASFKLKWSNHQGNTVNPVYSEVRFTDNESFGSLSSLESLAMIDRVIINLYEGHFGGDIKKLKKLDEFSIYKSANVDIKNLFYDNGYKIYSLDTFGLTMDDLIKSYGEQLSEYYTISVEAYTDTGYKIDLVNSIYPYKVSSSLFVDEITKPKMQYKAISKSESEYKFANLNAGGTVVGYEIKTSFDNGEFKLNNADVKRINYYVYDKNKEKVKFYVLDENKELKLVDKYSVEISSNTGEEGDENVPSWVLKYTNIYLDYGLAYESIDDVMRRGNKYYIGYELEILFEGETETERFPEADPETAPTDYGMYELVEPYKEAPDIDMYIATSDKNSITYKYVIRDPDNVIYKKPTDKDYNIYYYKNSDDPVKTSLIRNEEFSYNVFEGRLKISNLASGDLYGIYYEANRFRTDIESSNIEQYFEGRGPILRTFDGYYDPNNAAYNLSYTIINDPNRDNKVAIKINATEKMLDRVLSYKLLFTADGASPFESEQWKLSVCPDDADDALPRCLYVDYTTLKAANMQGKDISVKVEMLYDNGLTGYDFKVGGNISDDYQYMIMQQNSSASGMGGYVITNNNEDLSTWSPDSSTFSRGYYTYEYIAEDFVINYYGKHLSSTASTYVDENVNLGPNGFTTNKGGYTLNPKMVSVVNMPVKGTLKKFSFHSITPKVKVSNPAPLLNGSKLSFELSGLDLNDIKNEDGEYYLYVATWDNSSQPKIDHKWENVVRPVVKVQINKKQPLESVSKIIDGLLDNKKYYHNVYAYMKTDDNKFEPKQLYDAGNRKANKVKTYEYTTLSNTGIFNYNSTESLKVSYSIPEIPEDMENPEVNLLPENYNNRNLDLAVNLYSYKSNVAYNFGLVYVMCEKDTEICDENNYIFRKEIPKSEMATYLKGQTINDSVLLDDVIPEGYNFEYGKHYTVYLFARFDDYYQTSTETTTRYLKLNQLNNDIELDALEEPTFIVTRTASIDTDGQYFIDFDITLSDPDRTLVNGEYFISLKQNGEQKGIMQLKDVDGVYVSYKEDDYSKYAFNGYITNQSVRITGLDPDSQYSLEIFGDVMRNNASIPMENRLYRFSPPSSVVYTANSLGVAFGYDMTYTATEKSVVVTFLGGSSFEKVKKVFYTVGLYEGENSDVSHTDTYDLEKDNKGFEYLKDDTNNVTNRDKSFIIDPIGMNNILGKTYVVTLKFCVGDDTDSCVWIPDENASEEEIKRFSGKAVYVK